MLGHKEKLKSTIKTINLHYSTSIWYLKSSPTRMSVKTSCTDTGFDKSSHVINVLCNIIFNLILDLMALIFCGMNYHNHHVNTQEGCISDLHRSKGVGISQTWFGSSPNVPSCKFLVSCVYCVKFFDIFVVDFRSRNYISRYLSCDTQYVKREYLF